jgi:glyoxylase-like metal-dependent hydrolase (beta-lactamase superfamily II)
LGLKVKYIVNTHGHLDHIGANREVHEFLKCPIAIGKADAPMLTDARLNFSNQYGQPLTSPEAELLLSQGDTISFGPCSLNVLSTPGHTQGGICLYGHGVLFSGDTLFQHSIGRSDFPGGSQKQLLNSINTKLLVLPDETRVLPGHGPETTIGEERVHNPWLQG